MDQLEGLLSMDKKKTCKFVKSLYGLKQTPKQWHEKFDKVMFSSKYKTKKINKCIYMKNTDKFYVIACLYLDDILILDNNDHMIKSIKKMLTNKFDMKDLGIVDVTRIQISKTYDGLVLSQSHYVEKIHEKRFKCDNSFVKTLIDISIHLSNNRGNGINQLGYY